MESQVVQENESALKAAMALNLCTTSISKIISTQDVNIMRHEYDYILNNINFEKIIKDEALLSTMKAILDTLSFYLIQEKDKDMIALKYQHKMNNAIWDSVMGIPNTVVLSFAGPVSAVISAAVSGAISIGSAYINYRRSKSNTKLERMQEEWQLERSALEQLHGLRLSLFETAWRLFANYRIKDEHRLSVKQVDLYNGILMEPNPKWRYQKLSMIQDYFEAYPYFWYELSEAAYQVYNSYSKQDSEVYSNQAVDVCKKYSADEKKSYLEKARIAIEKFFSIIKGKELLRQDAIYASAIVRKIQICCEERIAENDDAPWSFAIDQAKEELGMKETAELEKLYSKLAADSPDLLMNAAMIFMAGYEEKKQKSDASAARKLLWMLVNQGYNVPMTTRLLSFIDLETDMNDYELLKDLVAGNQAQCEKIKILRNKKSVAIGERLPHNEELILTEETKKDFWTAGQRCADTIAELKQVAGSMFDIALKKACPIFNENCSVITALTDYFKANKVYTAQKAQEEIENYLKNIYAELNVQCRIWQNMWDSDFLTMYDAVKPFKEKIDKTLKKVGSDEHSPYMQAESVCKLIALFRAYFISRMVLKLLNEKSFLNGKEKVSPDLLKHNVKYFNDRLYDLRCKLSLFHENYFIRNFTSVTDLMDYSVDYFSGEQKITSSAWNYKTDSKAEMLSYFIKKHQDIIVKGVPFEKSKANDQLVTVLQEMEKEGLKVLVYNLGAPIPPADVQEKAYPFWSEVTYIWNYVFNCRNTRVFRRQYDSADYRIALYPSKIMIHYNSKKKK